LQVREAVIRSKYRSIAPSGTNHSPGVLIASSVNCSPVRRSVLGLRMYLVKALGCLPHRSASSRSRQKRGGDWAGAVMLDTVSSSQRWRMTAAVARNLTRHIDMESDKAAF
jgi:hypothetical protein